MTQEFLKPMYSSLFDPKSLDFYKYRQPNRPEAYIMAPSYDLAKHYWRLQGPLDGGWFQFVGTHNAYRGLPLSKPIFVIVGDKFGSFIFPKLLQNVHWWLLEDHHNVIYKTMEMPITAAEYFWSK